MGDAEGEEDGIEDGKFDGIYKAIGKCIRQQGYSNCMKKQMVQERLTDDGANDGAYMHTILKKCQKINNYQQNLHHHVRNRMQEMTLTEDGANDGENDGENVGENVGENDGDIVGLAEGCDGIELLAEK